MLNFGSTKIFCFWFFRNFLAQRFYPVDSVGILIVFINVEILPVYQYTYGTVFAENTGFDLINSRGQDQNAGFIFFPEEMVGDSVGWFDFPGNQTSRTEITGLPHPSTDNILWTESLIDGALVFQDILKLGFCNFLV